jgi:hypothetical protein
MVNDLSLQLKEWTPIPVKVVGVLGPPSHTNYAANTVKARKKTVFMRYPLGRNQRELFSISQYYLLLKFDKNGHLDKAEVHPE